MSFSNLFKQDFNPTTSRRMRSNKAIAIVFTLVLWGVLFARVSAGFNQSGGDQVFTGGSVELRNITTASAVLNFESRSLTRQEIMRDGERFTRFHIEDGTSVAPEGMRELRTVGRDVLIPPRSGSSAR